MLPGARMFFEGGGDGALEYIETPRQNANCYITTSVVTTTDLTLNLKMLELYADENPQCPMIGTTEGWSAKFLLWMNYRKSSNTNELQWHFGGKYKSAMQVTKDAVWDMTLSKTGMTVNGTSQTLTGAGNPGSGKVMVCGTSTGTGDQLHRCPHCRIFSFNMSKSGVEVFHGVPWLMNGVAGLYDTIGETFYPSEGVDKFIDGPLAPASS